MWEKQPLVISVLLHSFNAQFFCGWVEPVLVYRLWETDSVTQMSQTPELHPVTHNGEPVKELSFHSLLQQPGKLIDENSVVDIGKTVGLFLVSRHTFKNPYRLFKKEIVKIFKNVSVRGLKSCSGTGRAAATSRSESCRVSRPFKPPSAGSTDLHFSQGSDPSPSSRRRAQPSISHSSFAPPTHPWKTEDKLTEETMTR